MSAPVLEVERPRAGEARLGVAAPEDPPPGGAAEESHGGSNGAAGHDGGENGQGWDDDPPPGEIPLSDDQRDRMILRIATALGIGAVALIAAVLAAGALGWVQPVCGGIFVTQTAGCDRAGGRAGAPSATALPWMPYPLEGLSITQPTQAGQPSPVPPR
jgi:hypothetical protein